MRIGDTPGLPEPTPARLDFNYWNAQDCLTGIINTVTSIAAQISDGVSIVKIFDNMGMYNLEIFQSSCGAMQQYLEAYYKDIGRQMPDYVKEFCKTITNCTQNIINCRGGGKDMEFLLSNIDAVLKCPKLLPQ